ncbi:sulfatase [Galbibacter mesophilus]|uniref:sulfatase n=1 Tax=Galbibacter mesophilus TaxID=379069 RepID=UPI00191FEAD4|nr:sulfatase [Galbibacter mesophilus]MCM5663889.1 sulfatase [Galbibacter mesophilus]
MRIRFYTIAIIIALGFIGCKKEKKVAEVSEEKAPNVIYLFADDLNDVVLGGHPQVKSPNIDKLIASGTSFTNAHTNAPLCAPCRASVLTGLLPSTTGYFGGAQYDFKENPNLKNAITFMEHFRENGYKVMGTGKIFHHKHQDTTVWVDKNGDYLHGYDASFGPFPWDGKGLPNNKKGWGVKHPSFPTLDTDVLPTSLADVPNYEPDPKNDIPGGKGWRLYYQDFKYNSEDDRDLMPDELSTKWVKEQLGKKHDKPFLLCVGFNRPHAPYIAPKKYFDMFPLEDIKIAETVENDTADCAEILVKKADYGTGAHGYDNYNAIKNLGPDGLKKWTQAYLACVAFVDDQVGQIIAALEKSDYADNTIIFFSSDHGYHMGEKKWLFKNTLWGKATRIPFVFSGPGIEKAKTTNIPVSLVDFYPTILELCGIEGNPNADTNQLALDGRSLSSILKGNDHSKEEEQYAVSYVSSKTNAGGEGDVTSYRDQHTAIISKTHRYIRTYNGEEELYNIQEDPNEINNLANDKNSISVLEKMRKVYENIE